jgi:hypothetical protein
MQGSDFDETRASARLPHLDIDIVHRRARAGDAEQISISVNAVPSFAAFGEFIEATNPFLFWARLAEMAWQPWLKAIESASLLQGPASPPPRPSDDRSTG